jgi:hypothetical protein
MADSKKTVRKPFALPKAGVKQAVLVDMIDLGENVEQFKQEEPHLSEKIAYVFQVKEINPDTGKRFEPSVEFAITLGKKGNLPKFFGNIRGRAITKEEMAAGVEWSDIVGENALITIEHPTSGEGNVYAKIANVSALPEDTAAFKADKYVRSEHWAARKKAYAEAVAEFGRLAPSPVGLTKEEIEEKVEQDDDDLPF